MMSISHKISIVGKGIKTGDHSSKMNGLGLTKCVRANVSWQAHIGGIGTGFEPASLSQC